MKTFKTLSGKHAYLIFLWDVSSWARKPFPASEMTQFINNVEKAERCPVTVLGVEQVDDTSLPKSLDSVKEAASDICERYKIPQDDVRDIGYELGDGFRVITLMCGGKIEHR